MPIIRRKSAIYQDVFDWRIRKWDGPHEYWTVTTGAEGERGINGGLVRRSPELNARTVNTIADSSLDEFAGEIEQRGGKISVPKMAIQGIGWLAFAQDPEGNTFGILEPDEAQSKRDEKQDGFHESRATPATGNDR